MTKVLIRFSHGLGDTVQLGIVLKHLRHFRPDWQTTVRCGRGKHSALFGLCHAVSHDQEPDLNDRDFDTVLDLGWFENFNRYPDRPNTKVTNALHEVFGLEWKCECGTYSVAIRPEVRERARRYLESIGCVLSDNPRADQYRAVIIHYEGNTSSLKKNLKHWQAEELCKMAIQCGRVPVILDWDKRSCLPDDKMIFRPACGAGDIWGGFGSGDAEAIAALIELSEAYVGIDSGPGKVASATTTPTLICWIGHHPIQFHDLAANTEHLLPSWHRKMPPVSDDNRVGDWFEHNYRFITFDNEHQLATRACTWLADKLGAPGTMVQKEGVQFVLPSGIGDTVWALLKINAIRNGEPVDLIVSGDPGRETDHRAVPFLKRFDFVRSVKVLDIPILMDRQIENATDARGRYRYVADGLTNGYHFLIPNAVLEKGERIETWLPDVPIDWNVMDHFSWEGTERGRMLGEALAPFAAFYLGPESGHTDEGHNRGWLWEPKHWIELGTALKKRGLNAVVVGANYDRSFWEKYVQTGVSEARMHWHDLIGKLEIGETFALLRQAKLLVSYQCGLGIVAHYLGVPTIMWWRPDQNSSHPRTKVCFDERMRHAWTRPDYNDRYYGAIYKRETVGDLLAEIDRKGWVK